MPVVHWLQYMAEVFYCEGWVCKGVIVTLSIITPGLVTFLGFPLHILLVHGAHTRKQCLIKTGFCHFFLLEVEFRAKCKAYHGNKARSIVVPIYTKHC